MPSWIQDKSCMITLLPIEESMMNDIQEIQSDILSAFSPELDCCTTRLKLSHNNKLVG